MRGLADGRAVGGRMRVRRIGAHGDMHRTGRSRGTRREAMLCEANSRLRQRFQPLPQRLPHASLPDPFGIASSFRAPFPRLRQSARRARRPPRLRWSALRSRSRSRESTPRRSSRIRLPIRGASGPENVREAALHNVPAHPPQDRPSRSRARRRASINPRSESPASTWGSDSTQRAMPSPFPVGPSEILHADLAPPRVDGHGLQAFKSRERFCGIAAHAARALYAEAGRSACAV